MGIVIGRDYTGNSVQFIADTHPVEGDATTKAEGAIIAGATTGATVSTNKAAGLTAVTAIANQQTPTTGGVTLASQVLAANAVWSIKAFGTYVAASSATARNFEITPYWGSTALTKIAVAVLASQAQTTGWDVEFILTGSSTTALWLAGRLINQVDTVTDFNATQIALATAASNTTLTTTSTIDLRFDTSASVSGDSINVHSVVISKVV